MCSGIWASLILQYFYKGAWYCSLDMGTLFYHAWQFRVHSHIYRVEQVRSEHTKWSPALWSAGGWNSSTIDVPTLRSKKQQQMYTRETQFEMIFTSGEDILISWNMMGYFTIWFPAARSRMCPAATIGDIQPWLIFAPQPVGLPHADGVGFPGLFADWLATFWFWLTLFVIY